MQFKLQLPTETWNVELETNDIRSEDFKMQQMSEKGMQTITLDKCPTYAGKVNGNDARFFIDNETFYGKVYLENETVAIVPLSWSVLNAPKNVWILYKNSDAIVEDRLCGVKAKTKSNNDSKASNRAMNLPTKCRVLKVAIDYDYEFYQLGGTSKAWAIMQEVDKIYTRDLELRVNVCYMGGWTNSQNPYSTTGLALDPVFQGFAGYWNANRNNIVRDCAHMFSGKSLKLYPYPNSPDANGVATNQPIGGGLQDYYSISDAGSRETDWQAVACHEIAHNLGHPGHDGDIGSNTTCTYKYIMCQGGNKETDFSINSKNVIGSFLNTNTSLGPRTPSIQAQLFNSVSWNYVNIASTPTFIASSGRNLKIVNNDPLIPDNTFTYSTNNSLVQFNQSVNPTFVNPNGAPHFTFTIKYTNTCGSFYRSIPLIAMGNAQAPIIYPNPTNGSLLIDFKEESLGNMLPKEVRVYSETQNLIYSKTIQNNDITDSNQLKIDLQNQPLGRYFVILIYSDGTTKKHQIIIDK